MDESAKPAGQSDEQPEDTSSSGAADTAQGDFTLEELIRAHNRNFDPKGRRVDRPKEGE